MATDHQGHYTAVCNIHGVVLSTCRCADPSKRRRQVACPGRACPGVGRPTLATPPEDPSAAVWIVFRLADAPEGTDAMPVVDRVLGSEDDMRRRIEALMRANPLYPWRQLGPLSWVTGPEEDEGFFGNRPVRVWVEHHQVR